MADLDSDLSHRLSRLAAAVPTARLDPVHLRAVEARHRVRMAWMTPLVALVVVVVVATLIGGVGQPGTTSEPSASTANGPVEAMTRSGQFELTIRAEKGRYEPGETIEIGATLANLGEDPVEIRHAQGAPVPGRGSVDGPDTGGTGGPVGFGIVEPVLDDLFVGTGWDLSCERSVLEPGKALTVPFQKGGGWSSDDPRAGEYRAYLEDPALRLTPGIWHVYAVAEFAIGDCAAAQVEMRVEIPIEVVATPSTSTGATVAGQSDVARDGPFALELRADKARYETGEAIDVSATLLYEGPEASVTFEHDDSGPIVFGIRERVFGEIGVGEINMLMGDRTTIVRNVPIVEDFQKGGGFDGEHPEVEKLRAWFEDPELHLPEGTWHISARASGAPVGSRDEAGLFNLSTEIEIVVDDPATEGHPTATEWADKPVYGGDDIGNMIFQVRSAHPTYVVGSPIEFDAYYWLAEGPPLAESPFIQEAAFSIVQVDPAATEVRTLEPEQRCAQTTVGRSEERHVPIDSSNVVLIKAASWPQLSADALERGVLDLPVGRWRITAVVRAEFGPCGSPDETWEVQASLEVDVLPRP